MKLTLGTTYYNNPDYLLRFIKRNNSYVDEIIVVDDGSKLAITKYLKPTSKLRLFRVKKDYGFNSHGCRNLIMKSTSNEWNVMIDVDREFTVPEHAYDIIYTTKLFKYNLYRFEAHGKNYRNLHHSVNDYLIHREHFFSAGGYDEEIIGQRWGDREYFEQLKKFGSEKTLYGVYLELTRSPSTIKKGNAVSPYDKRINSNSKLIKKRIKNPDPNKPILTFEWEEIT